MEGYCGNTFYSHHSLCVIPITGSRKLFLDFRRRLDMMATVLVANINFSILWSQGMRE